MNKNLKIFFGVGGIVVVLGTVLLILWAVGVFAPPLPGRTLSGNRILNTYTLSPTDTWTYWGPEGSEIRGIGIQKLANDLFVAQKYKAEVEFANNRVVVFLLPGRYKHLHLQVGYYTSIVGLGEKATDTIVQGTIEVPNNPDPCIGALDNDFRNIANLTLEVDTSTLFSDDITNPEAPTVVDQSARQRFTNYFRVSQASPIRNIVVRGPEREVHSPHHPDARANFAVAQFSGGCAGNFDSGGYASGGFMSNVVVIDGEMRFGTQQQFFSRNCEYDIRTATLGGGGLWNIYLLGCVGETGLSPLGRRLVKAATNECPPNSSDVDDDNDSENDDDVSRPPPLITWKETTPGLMASIPQIRYDPDGGGFWILKPDLVEHSSGVLPVGGKKLTGVFVVRPDTSIEEINQNLAAGAHMIFSPWVYHFAEPVRITQPRTVVVALGYATIIPTGGQPAIVVADAAVGVRLSGFLLQAGKNRSEALLMVGERPREGGSSADPTIIYDIFSRVGGGEIEAGADPAVANPDSSGSCKTMVVVNQNHTIVDHLWCWRADHVGPDRSGLGPDFAQVDHGVAVRGDRVKMFGVFADNALKEQLIWEGDRGALYFQKSVLPSDVAGDDWNYPGTRVIGRHFKGGGMGVYAFFSDTHTADLDPPAAAPEVPTAFLVFDEDDAEVAATAEIESCFTVFLDGGGGIQSVLNGRGPPSNAANATKPQWCGTLCAAVNDCECQLPFSQWCDAGERQ